MKHSYTTEHEYFEIDGVGYNVGFTITGYLDEDGWSDVEVQDLEGVRLDEDKEPRIKFWESYAIRNQILSSPADYLERSKTF